MDLPHSILPYLGAGPNSATSLNSDDPLTFLFPSSATDVDDTTVTSKLPLNPNQQPPSSTTTATTTTTTTTTHVPPVSHPHAHPQPTNTSTAQPVPSSQPLDSFLENAPPAHAVYDPSLGATNPTAYSLSLLPSVSPDPNPPPSLPLYHYNNNRTNSNNINTNINSNHVKIEQHSVQLNNTVSTPLSTTTTLPQTHHPINAPVTSSVSLAPSPLPSTQLPAQPSSHPQRTPVQHQSPAHVSSSYPLAPSSAPLVYPLQNTSAPMSAATSTPTPTPTPSPSYPMCGPMTLPSHPPPPPPPQKQQQQSYAPIQSPKRQVSTTTPPQSQSASLSHSSCGTPRTNTRPSSKTTSRRTVKRDRSLHVMKAIASNNAPDVVLSDDELLQIGAMHESELHLAQSRDLYQALVIFKQTLSKHGYKLSAIHLDALDSEAAIKAFNDPIDFVLQKNNNTDNKKKKNDNTNTTNNRKTEESLEGMKQDFNLNMNIATTTTTTSSPSSLPLPSISATEDKKKSKKEDDELPLHQLDDIKHEHNLTQSQTTHLHQFPVSAVGKRSTTQQQPHHGDDLIPFGPDIPGDGGPSPTHKNNNNSNNNINESKYGGNCGDDDDDNDLGDVVMSTSRKRRRSEYNSASDSTGGEADGGDNILPEEDTDHHYGLLNDGSMDANQLHQQLSRPDGSFDNNNNNISLPEHPVRTGKAASSQISRPRKRGRFGSGSGGESCTSSGIPVTTTNTSTQHAKLGCVVCCKVMSDIDTLVRHFRHAHQELKPFSCPRCRGLYSSEGTLWHHIRNVHTETPRKYKCDYCDASYDSFGAKTRHEHATHNTSSPQFVCTFKGCNRKFNFPAHLEAHALHSHDGFKPFACDECPKRFPSANGLTRHAREVHLRPQAYSCSCSKSYSKRCHLKRHLLRVHHMSIERVQEEMKKQPHPGLLHMVPRAPPASTD